MRRLSRGLNLCAGEASEKQDQKKLMSSREQPIFSAEEKGTNGGSLGTPRKHERNYQRRSKRAAAPVHEGTLPQNSER